MTLSMAESLLFSTTESLLKKLTSSYFEEAFRFLGMDFDRLKFMMILSMFNALMLDADRKQKQNSHILEWVRQLKHLSYDAQILIDEAVLDYGTPIAKVGGLFSDSYSFFPRYRMADQIFEIRKRLGKVASDMHNLRLGIIKVHMHVVHKREMTHSFVNDSDVIGRGHDKEKIIELLMQPSTCDAVPVIPIVGMGGMGKTTLAKLVFHDRRIEECFPLKIWVCVSDGFYFKQLNVSIIYSAFADDPTHQQNFVELGMEQLRNRLRNALTGKKFLLVLDDMDHVNWFGFRQLIKVGAEGSKILVTARSQLISSMMGTIPSHILEGLSLDDSLSLLKEWVFEEGEEEDYPDLIEVGREIVKKCGGVPLAIRTIGRALYSKRGIHEWVAVRDDEIRNLPQEEYGILHALKLSYDKMPSYLRQCFALFSLYPKDFVFHNSEVTSLWAASGLLPSPKRNESFTDVANQCLYDLKSAFFLHDFVNFGTSCYFKIHELVHNLAFCVAKDDCLMMNSNIEKTPDYVQHLSFIENDFLGKSFTPSYVGVRTILFPIEGMGAISEAFLNMCVSRYKYLRILDLSDSTYETLPRSVGKLRHLRFLSLERNEKIKRVPDSISKLQNLQVLDLSGCTKLQRLPKGLRNLTSLQQLGITTKQFALPENDIANLSSLEILNIKSCDNMESLFVEIKLPSLKTLTVTNCGSLKSLPLDINHFPQLETLLVDNCGNLELSKGHDDRSSNLRLKAIRLHSLQQLATLPHWLQESADTLQSLLIVDCKNLEVLPQWLSALSFLKSFCISDCPKLTFLPNDIHRLTAIEYLRIEGCPKLCRKLQPLVGEYWSKISHIKQIFIGEPEDPEKK